MSELLQPTTADGWSELFPRIGPFIKTLPLAGQLALTTTFAFAGTSTVPANPVIASARNVLQRTNTGFVYDLSAAETVDDVASPATEDRSRALAELRRLSGLTWEQLARLFDVDRRSLHFWASGKPMHPRNEERLNRVLAAIRDVDRGSATETRRALLSEIDGTIPFDLLLVAEYDRFVEAVGRGPQLSRNQPALLSREARETRAPRPPEELVDALNDRDYINKGKGRLLSSAPIRTGRKD